MQKKCSVFYRGGKLEERDRFRTEAARVDVYPVCGARGVGAGCWLRVPLRGSVAAPAMGGDPQASALGYEAAAGLELGLKMKRVARSALCTFGEQRMVMGIYTLLCCCGKYLLSDILLTLGTSTLIYLCVTQCIVKLNAELKLVMKNFKCFLTSVILGAKKKKENQACHYIFWNIPWFN